MDHVKAYWWRNSAGSYNFGDELTPLLLEHFSGLKVERSSVYRADIIAVGSVLEHIPPGWDGFVLGSGRLRPGSALNLRLANILALRGPLSAHGIPGTYALGDPGLLAAELVTVETKKYGLGIVPHWSDKTLAKDPRFLKYSPKIIDPSGDPLEVIRTIGECRKIVSSSLHGLILADAFGVPRRFEYTPQFDREGGEFKFRDYNASVKLPMEIGKLQEPRRYNVEDRQHELFDCFGNLGTLFGGAS